MTITGPERFLTTTLSTKPWGQAVTRILAAALQAVEPQAAVNRHMRKEGRHLYIGDRVYDLDRIQRVFVVGAGKAGAPMARAIADILGDHLHRGIVIVKEGYAGDSTSIGPISIIEAGHPIPDERGCQGAEQIIDLLKSTQEEDLVICLISGGGSAILVSPMDGLTLTDLQDLTSTLLASGATINQINALRKHLDRVKGGKLAKIASPAPVVSLILSDVVADPLEYIASGPTVPDPTSFSDVVKILEQLDILEQVPPAVLDHIRKGVQGEIPENPKPGDPIFKHVHNVLVGSNLSAANAALQHAELEGFHTLLLTTFLQGEACQISRVLTAIARQLASSNHPLPRPACLLAGGETTVTLKGDGKGGRNQEIALAAVSDLAGLDDIALVTFATDGGDGPTDAAGAVVTGETLLRAQQIELNPLEFLSRNDSYNFFDPLGDLIKTGPTQTNVNDLAFIFGFE
ncbi:MAG: glycerate kinase [Anaerolineales bacterium]|nr:glycerate kinase [Anaerolineales bacterium]